DPSATLRCPLSLHDALPIYQLLVAFVERPVQHLVRVGVQAGEHLLEGPRHPGRGLLQPGTVRVLATGNEQLAHGLLGARQIECRIRILSRSDDVFVLVDVDTQPRVLTADDDRPRRPVDAAPARSPRPGAGSAAGCTCRGSVASATSPAASRAEPRSSAAPRRSTWPAGTRTDCRCWCHRRWRRDR